MAEQALAERDRDFWSTRVAALASLAAADALAVVLPLPDGRYVAYAEHNVGQDRAWLDGPAQYLVWSAVKQRTVHRRAETQVPLRDGTIANSLAVAPIPWGDRIVGALVSLRCAETYETTVGAPTEDLARLVGLELAVSSVLQRAAAPDPGSDAELRRAIDDRRHAIALYEVSRQALRPTGSGRIAPVLADTLGYGLVGVWIEQEGELRLADGHGYDGAPGTVRPAGDAMLERVLREGTTQRVQRPANAPAWMGAAGEVILTPLGGEGGRGVLVFGEPVRPFGAADLTIAPSLAECVSLARAQRAIGAPERARELPPVAAAGPSTGPAAAPAAVAAAPSQAAPAPRAASAPTSPPAPPGAAVTPSAAATDSTPAARARRGWVLPLFVLALIAGVVGVVLTEPLIFVLAGLLLLVAFWGWLA